MTFELTQIVFKRLALNIITIQFRIQMKHIRFIGPPELVFYPIDVRPCMGLEVLESLHLRFEDRIWPLMSAFLAGGSPCCDRLVLRWFASAGSTQYATGDRSFQNLISLVIWGQ
jgi:hypothetical protein